MADPPRGPDRPKPPRRRKRGSPSRNASGRFTGQRHIVLGGENDNGQTVWVMAVDVDDPDALTDDDLFAIFEAGLEAGEGSAPHTRNLGLPPISAVKIYRPELRRRPIILPTIRRSELGRRPGDVGYQPPPEPPTEPPRRTRRKR